MNKILSHTVAATLLIASSSWGLASDTPKPNIVLLLADDLGFTDVGAFGSEISTPNIDVLARQGRMFSNYHTASSCAPTRAMLMSGLSSHQAGLGNMPESLAPEMRGNPEYSGFLRPGIPTIAEHLQEGGYKTYVAGKWHLGATPDTLPSARGFDKTFILADTGGDNWEQKPYLPIYDQANWYADGERTTLPDDFYSSKTLIDKTIDFIDSDSNDAPFFAYVAFQAVHIPVQAPVEFTNKYLETYKAGWSELRRQRYKGAIKAGIVPEGLELEEMATTEDWNTLSAEEQRYEAKSMAVYAGMVEAMDFHIGRLIEHLKATGQYDNTLFIFTSDNGAEPSDTLGRNASSITRRYFSWWLSQNNYNTDYETLGEKGSYNMIGASFASAAASPLSFYKFYNGEGGMRVPLIISGPGVNSELPISRAFTFVTDIVPTVLGIANADPIPGAIGKSLVPLLNGTAESNRDANDGVGFELGGNATYFLGDYKLVLNRGPVGDNEWHLYNIVQDPTERKDLKNLEPELFTDLKTRYEAYAKEHGVLEVPPGYDQRMQVARNQARALLQEAVPIMMAITAAIVIGLIFLIRIWRSRRAA
jgi:arylsulfatase A-like enzyme